MRALVAAILLAGTGIAHAASVTLPSVTFTAGSPVYMGDKNIETVADSANGDLLIVHDAMLGQAGTLQSVSIYARSASGNLILGVYDASGVGGRPGNLLAQTASFAVNAGWNTVNTTTQPSLPAGNYWLASLPSSGSLVTVSQTTSGGCYYYSHTFSSPLPTTYSTSPISCTPQTWSLYATLNAAPTGVQVTGISLSNTTLTMPNPGVVVGAVSVTTLPSGSNFTGVITLGGADASDFALTNGGQLPCNLIVGTNSLAAGTYAITLSAP